MNHQGDDFVRLQELQEAVTATEQLLEEKNESLGILE